MSKLNFTCKTCGVPFIRLECQAKRHATPPKYCSMKCRGLGMRNRKTVKCATCKKEFERAAAEVARRGEKSWCSWGCWKKYYDEHRTSYPKIGGRHIHRIVAEKMAGRPLTSKDVVHHKDEDRQNFEAGNLKLMDRKKHGRLHGRKLVKFKKRNESGKFAKR